MKSSKTWLAALTATWALASSACDRSEKAPATGSQPNVADTASSSDSAKPTAAPPATEATPPGSAPDSETTQTQAKATTENTAMIGIPNAIMYDGMLTGGQPSEEQLKEAADSGYKTIINLRGEGESGYEFETKAAEELGMSYTQIPVNGANGLTRENVEAFDKALSQADGKVMVHCAGGNRVGALFALRAAWLQGKSVEEAMKIGKESGLTRLEDAVKALLSE